MKHTKQATRDTKGRYFSYRRLIHFIILTIAAVILALTFARWDRINHPVELYNPLIESHLVKTTYRFVTPAEAAELTRQRIPNMVESAVDRFTTSDKQKNRLMGLMWCLLREESTYGENEDCGDSGKSCGILQYREATYNRIRKEMIKKGLVDELGDRFSEWYSIETTAYAMVNGYKGEWGPVKRGECY